MYYYVVRWCADDYIHLSFFDRLSRRSACNVTCFHDLCDFVRWKFEVKKQIHGRSFVVYKRSNCLSVVWTEIIRESEIIVRVTIVSLEEEDEISIGQNSVQKVKGRICGSVEICSDSNFHRVLVQISLIVDDASKYRQSFM